MKRYLLLLLLLQGCAGISGARQPVPLESLVSDPIHWDKMVITTHGFLILNPEGNLICNKPDEQDPKLCVLLDLNLPQEDVWPKYGVLQGKHVSVKGRFFKEDLSTSAITHSGNIETIHFGPLFHEIHNISVIEATGGR